MILPYNYSRMQVKYLLLLRSAMKIMNIYIFINVKFTTNVIVIFSGHHTGAPWSGHGSEGANLHRGQ